MGAMANNSTASYVGWEEVVVSSEKGRREVHYYLKRAGGGADLVVVGKEKSFRHMSYYYAIKDNKALLSNLKRSSILKLRSSREVIDWLNSILTVSGEQADGSFRQFGDDMESKLDVCNMKDAHMQKMSQYRTEFTWLGSPWTCRKRRRHYQSFCRNGVVISLQDFVYVLAEEDKRLVAYLDDMYEDSRGNKMVVVRWFHKIDEVGFVLPRNYNDREIFFSLCLQDISVECIDGRATVLSPEHYEKFMNEATYMGLAPFVCCRQFDNDDVKPFDVTHIKGYWKQEMLRKLHCSSSLLDPFDEDLKVKFSLGDDVGCRPNKRIRTSKEGEMHLKPANKRDAVETLQVCSGSSIDSRGGVRMGSLKEGCSHASVSEQDDMLPTYRHHLTIGSQVEVLSQDSGLRGCWFRALIIKKHKDKVKVQYQDIKDAVDDAKYLEEWILMSRLAAPDVLDIRVSGRTIVRPTPLSDDGRVCCVINVGSIVDAWWHDGWWEGVVVRNESENKLHVYFPGEKQEQIFSPSDLRQSQEWFDSGWKSMKARPELVSILSEHETLLSIKKFSHVKQEGGPFSNRYLVAPFHNDDLPQKAFKIHDCLVHNDDKMPNESEIVRDLSKDYLLAQLRWKSSGKRRRSRSPVHKLFYGANGSNDYTGMQTFEKFFVSPSLNFDPDYCKYANDSHFSSSVVSPMTSMVMSR